MSLLTKRRLPAILAGFTKTLAELSELAEANKKEVAVNQEKVAKLNAKSDELNAETSQAEAVKANIEKLLETPKS